MNIEIGISISDNNINDIIFCLTTESDNMITTENGLFIIF